MLRARHQITVGHSQAFALAVALLTAVLMAGGLPHLSLAG